MTADVWVDDHDPIDTPEKLFTHLADDHGLVEAQGLDPDRAPVQFWARKHTDLHHDHHYETDDEGEPDDDLPTRPAPRRPGRPRPITTDASASAETTGRGGEVQPAGGPPTQPSTTTTTVAADRPRGVRAGGRRMVGLIRAYLLAAVMLLAITYQFVPASAAETAPGYRLEISSGAGPDGGLLDAAGVLALKAAGWVTGQAADRQADLLAANPLANRVLAPALQQTQGWIQPYRLPIAVAGTLLIATLVFLGVYGLPTRQAEGVRVRMRRRWWLLGVTLTLLTVAVVCFPAQTLSVADAPGLLTARHTVNLSATHLLPPDSLDASKAEGVQARLAEAYWTQFVTGQVSRRETRSSILTHTPAEHRAEVTAYLHGHGVQPARGLHGAVISTSALGSAVAAAVVIGGAAWVALAAQTALVLLLLAGVVLVPVWAARRQIQRLIFCWLLPVGILTLLLAGGVLASVAATRGAALIASVWELVTTTVSGAAVAVAMVALVGWRVRRRVRRWRARRQRRHETSQAAADHATRADRADAADSGRAGVAA